MMQLNTKNVEIIIFFAFYYLHFERDVLSYRRIRRNYGRKNMLINTKMSSQVCRSRKWMLSLNYIPAGT